MLLNTNKTRRVYRMKSLRAQHVEKIKFCGEIVPNLPAKYCNMSFYLCSNIKFHVHTNIHVQRIDAVRACFRIFPLPLHSTSANRALSHSQLMAHNVCAHGECPQTPCSNNIYIYHVLSRKFSEFHHVPVDKLLQAPARFPPPPLPRTKASHNGM